MKRFLLLVVLATTLVLSSCKFDDADIWNKLNNHEQRITALEELCKQMNTNIVALQTVVSALEKNDYITNVAPIRKDGKEIGYTISFAYGDTITIYHGENGKDGYTPQIGVMKDTDGIYYWTVDGEWLLDGKSNKIQANGVNGTNGDNGTDGTTPCLKIENDYWYISYDNGTTWQQLGKATGTDGTDGENSQCVFANVTQDDEYVYFHLGDETMITLPKHSKVNILSVSYIPRYSDGKADIDYDTKTVELDFQVLPKTTIATLSEVWSSALKAKTTYAATRAVSYLDTPIIEYSANEENATITIKVSLKNLDEDFFSGIKEASVALQISDGNNSICSDYINIYDRNIYEIRYTTTDNTKITTPTIKNNTLISHTYHNGVGVIRYSAPIYDIPDRAYYNVDKLKTIELPHMASIGEAAFDNCDKLTNVTIGGGAASIGHRAFIQCSSITSITIPDSVTSIGDSAFYECGSVESITIGNGITSIGSDAFSSCTGVLTINGDIPSANSAENGAFYGNKFKEVIIGKDNKMIGNYAFAVNPAIQNNSITKITIGNNTTSIGDSAFSYCSNLTSINIPNNVTTIGNNAFDNCRSVTTLTIPDSVIYIGNYAFYGCIGLTNLTISSNISHIGDYTFSYCSNITSITIPDSVTSIGEMAFSYCNGLTSITIPDSVTSIGVGAFYGCSSATNITIGKGVASINAEAFEGCSNLKSIYCKPTTPPAIYYGYSYSYAGTYTTYVFPYNDNIRIYVPIKSYNTYMQYSSYVNGKMAPENWYHYSYCLEPYDFE